MHRGVEIGIFLQPNLHEEEFVARALGNLAAFRLAQERKEPLEWQVLRVQTSEHQHHYRLIVRHPDRVLDLGFRKDLERILSDLSDETEEQLRGRLQAAEREGLKAQPLRHVKEEVDFWEDKFWEYIGGPYGFGPLPPAK